MRRGIVVSNMGDYSDPREAVRLARAAEDAGWEGFFIWDHLGFAWDAPSRRPVGRPFGGRGLDGAHQDRDRR